MTITEMDKAYVAGIIDGEGTISLAKRPNRTHLRVRVVNTDLKLMAYLAETTGANYFSTGRAPCDRPCEAEHVHKNHQTYIWQCVGLRALVVIHNIWPYLLVKRSQAKEPRKWRPKIRQGRDRVLADLEERGWTCPKTL